MEEVTSTAKTISDGNVTITVEKYQELLAKAAQAAPIIRHTILKTDKMVADENRMWGAVFLGGGISLSVIGGLIYRTGVRQKSAL